MIAHRKQIERSVANSICDTVAKEFSRKYAWLDELEDCNNYLAQKLPSILNSQAFSNCNYPKAYLRQSLRNEANRFFQSRFKQIDGFETNQEVGALSRANGIFRNHQNRFGKRDLNMELDVRDFLSRSPSTELQICVGFMRGETCESIGEQLGMSKQAVHKYKLKVKKRANSQLKEYKHDCS